jgi:drug/metabolite transporter (DMT)-like permease
VLGRIISIEAPSLVFWRVFIAGLAMALWLAAINPALLRLPRRRLLAVLGLGFLQGAHWVCFFWSISLSNVSVALAAFATISLFTAITEPLIERRPIRPGELLCGGIVIAGILFIAGNLGNDHRLGLMVGLTGALLHSIFPVLNRQLVARGTPSRSMLLYEMAGACLMAALVLPLISPHHFQIPTGRDWLPLLTLALLCTTVAHTWNIHLLRRLTAYTANLTMNFEPVWGILLGAILFHEYEQLHPAFYLGTVLIIIANFLDPWLKARHRSSPAATDPAENRN